MSDGISPVLQAVLNQRDNLRAENKRLLEALRHAVHRTHQHSDNCSGCKEVARALDGGVE